MYIRPITHQMYVRPGRLPTRNAGRRVGEYSQYSPSRIQRCNAEQTHRVETGELHHTHSSNSTARSQAALHTDQQKLCIFLQPGCRNVYSRHCTEEVHLVCCHTIGLLVEHGGQILVPKLVYVGTSYGKRRPGNRMHRGEFSSIHFTLVSSLMHWCTAQRGTPKRLP